MKLDVAACEAAARQIGFGRVNQRRYQIDTFGPCDAAVRGGENNAAKTAAQISDDIIGPNARPIQNSKNVPVGRRYIMHVPFAVAGCAAAGMKAKRVDAEISVPDFVSRLTNTRRQIAITQARQQIPTPF